MTYEPIRKSNFMNHHVFNGLEMTENMQNHLQKCFHSDLVFITSFQFPDFILITQFQNLFFSQINLITTHDIFCIWGGFFHSDWKFISLLNLFVRIIWNSIFRIYFVFIQALSSFQIKDFNKNRKQISVTDSFEIWEYAIFYWQFGIVDTIKFVT